MGIICSNILAVQAVDEATYGVDPGSGYTAILVNQGASITPSGQEITRSVLRSTFSQAASVIGAKVFDISLPVEIKGGGVSGGSLVTPEFDLLLKACATQSRTGQWVTYGTLTGTFAVGETVTITAGAAGAAGTIIENTGSALYLVGNTENIDNTDGLTGVTSGATATASADAKELNVYSPLSSCAGSDSITLRFSYNGIRYVATGVRGSVSFAWDVNNYGIATFTFTGIYAAPTDQSLPSVNPLDIIPPRVAGSTVRVGTTTVSNFAIENFAFDLANNVVQRMDVKATDCLKEVAITGRNPRGSFNPDMTTLAEHNPYTLWEASNVQNISLQYGSASGNIVRAIWPYAQTISIGTSDRNGVMAYDLGFLATGSDTGNDEFFLCIVE